MTQSIAKEINETHNGDMEPTNEQPLIVRFNKGKGPETRTFDFRLHEERMEFVRFASWTMKQGISFKTIPITDDD